MLATSQRRVHYIVWPQINKSSYPHHHEEWLTLSYLTVTGVGCWSQSIIQCISDESYGISAELAGHVPQCTAQGEPTRVQNCQVSIPRSTGMSYCISTRIRRRRRTVGWVVEALDSQPRDRGFESRRKLTVLYLESLGKICTRNVLQVTQP